MTSGNPRNTPYLNPSGSRAAGLGLEITRLSVQSFFNHTYPSPKHRPAVKDVSVIAMLMRTYHRTYDFYIVKLPPNLSN